MERTPAPGENLAVLRKARELSQTKLARSAGLSVSYLSKLEVGQRPVTPPVAAALSKALHVSVQRIYGTPFLGPSEQADLLTELRSAVRRYTLPKEDVPDPGALALDVERAMKLRAQANYLELLGMLPKLLGQVTATALTAGAGEAGAWSQVNDVYGCAYSAAHRLAQSDLSDMIVSRQHWAATQTWSPGAEVAAAWNEAGTYQSSGEYDDGLAIVERAISKYESAVPGDSRERSLYLGSLHLRGIVLASRNKDKRATADHLKKAKRYAEKVQRDVLYHNLTFGQENTSLYELAAQIELGNPDKAVTISDPLMQTPPATLSPARLGRLYIDVARARLDVKQYAGAEEALGRAFAVAPQMTEIHPMSREVVRVLVVLHQRTRPQLMDMVKKTGLSR
ncbi:helix-turn-helix transcriptional regulator [Streptomyces sp. DSM 41014]|uniref:Helix-turn-helix transcriptional regulator n=1 Tax=Streptomyces hintoniae TaxID=3075521 RepID=A0ABU2UHP7_9ACTN|nr:helix-turn-helix transcriptional regulator [Streptomyces sp. DSM 41014]MDT0472792.1 helix-turn-helix transcriptional regulator [Streptomyces sp. DSM 41014]